MTEIEKRPPNSADDDMEENWHAARDRDAPKGLFAFLEVRSNRKEYWLSMGFAVALAITPAWPA